MCVCVCVHVHVCVCACYCDITRALIMQEAEFIFFLILCAQQVWPPPDCDMQL